MTLVSAEYSELSVADIRQGLRTRRFSAEELANAALATIELREEGRVEAFLSLTADLAFQAAREVDSKLLSDPHEMGLLAGVPIGFKDNVNLQGSRTTCGSKMLETYESSFSATCALRVIAEGALPLGKLNMDEFAFGSSTETSAYKKTHNPWDLDRVPGGSSGGSAAAVAAGMITVSLGSDTGGSIRQPASFCGVVGFKPSYGVVSRYGVAAFGSSLDQVGPFGRSVADVAAVTDALCGRDARDCTSQDIEPRYLASALSGQTEGIQGMRVGVVPEYLEPKGATREIISALKTAIKHLEDLGAQLVEVELPNARAALSAYHVIGPCEAYSNLSRFDSIRYGHAASNASTMNEQYEKSRAQGFGAETRRRILLGSYLLSSGVYDRYYYPAQQVRTLIIQDYARAFEQADVLLTPVSPCTAFRFGEVSDPISMYLSDIFTIPINIAGNGGLSLPVGRGEQSGLPVAVQIIGPQFKDTRIMRVAAALEASYDIERVAPMGDAFVGAPSQASAASMNTFPSSASAGTFFEATHPSKGELL